MWVLLLIFTTVVFSQNNTDEELALKVAQQFSKVEKPLLSSPAFTHWVYNTASFTAIHCWKVLAKDKDLPAILKNSSNTASGSWTLPQRNRELCISIASKGFNPECQSSLVWIKGVQRKPGLPNDYIQVDAAKPLLAEGVLKCTMNADLIDPQSYAGPLTAEWSGPPTLKTINLLSGPRTLKAGTLIIKAPYARGIGGSPYREAKMAVIIGP